MYRNDKVGALSMLADFLARTGDDVDKALAVVKCNSYVSMYRKDKVGALAMLADFLEKTSGDVDGRGHGLTPRKPHRDDHHPRHRAA
jgi:hypothetical protein